MKENYIALLEDLITRIDKIDKDTPWQECEPEWWFDMMDFRKSVHDRLIKIRDRETK